MNGVQKDYKSKPENSYMKFKLFESYYTYNVTGYD